MSSRSRFGAARQLPPIDDLGAKPEFVAPQPAQSADEQGLWQAFARSVRDNVFAEIALQVIRVGGMIVLARALMPNDFGIFRVLLIVMYFALIPIENGIPEALIQRRQILPEHESTGWFLSVVVAILMAGAIYFAAPLIARLMLMPAIVPYIRLLCIPLVCQGTAMVSNARLRREMRFGALASAEVFAEMVFLAAALVLLVEGHPRWSLPGALAARIFAYSAALWFTDRRFTAAWPRLWAVRDFGRFTTSVWGARTLLTCSSNADFLLVGRFLGSGALGFYGMAWDLLRFVPDRLFRVAGRVTFPAFSRVQDDDPQLVQAFSDFTGYIARFVLPIMAMAAIAAPQFIGVAYGQKWMPAALCIRLLAIGFTLMGLRIGIGSVFYAKDHPSYDMWTHGIRLILILATVAPLAMLVGLGGISADMAMVEGAVSLIGLALAAKLIGTSLGHLLRTAVPGLKLAIVCSLAALAGKELALAAGMNELTVLLAEALPALAVFLLMEASVLFDMIAKAFRPAPTQAA
jgi:PST family polysaccharide transporter